MDNERIRHRAHQIWESEGRPEGRQARHWAQAEEEIRREDAGDGQAGDGGVNDGGYPDDSLSELPAEAVAGDASQADGRIVEAGEGGTAGGLDEAEEAILSPVHPDLPDRR